MQVSPEAVADNIGAWCTAPQAPSHTEGHFRSQWWALPLGAGARFALTGGKPDGLEIYSLPERAFPVICPCRKVRAQAHSEVEGTL